MNANLFTGLWLTQLKSNYDQNDKNYYIQSSSIVYEKKFILSKVTRMKARICCLGYYIIKVNNHLITKDVLNNDWTCYSKRKYYEEYDISDYINIGQNIITVELGNGMYNPAPLRFFGKHNFREHLDVGEPKFILNIICENHILVKTDKTWKAYTGNLKFNNIYLGEISDAKFAGKEVKYKLQKISQNDRNSFMKSFIPKCKEFTAVLPKQIHELTHDKLLVDFGQIISGFIKLKVNLQAPKEIKLTYCESKDDNGNLDFTSSYAGGIGRTGVFGGPGSPRKALEIDKIFAPIGESLFKNKFTFHSFRYVIIQGIDNSNISLIQAIPVHTDLKQIGKVDIQNDFLTQLFNAGLRTRLNNIHSVFEDCARERLQYGGDIVALSTSMFYTFDLSQFNKKVIDDFILSQTRKGGIPETAPYVGIHTQGTDEKEGPLLWQLVLPYLTYRYYQFYGDIDFIKYVYKYIKKQYDYFKTWQLNDLAQHCIGDHGSPTITGEFYSTPDKLFIGYCTILLFNEINLKLAKIINQDTSMLENDNNKIRQEIHQLFANDDGSFGDKTETSSIFALILHLGNTEKLKNRIVNNIKSNNYTLSSGIFGQSLLYTELHQLGCDDIIYNWLTNNTKLGFKWMLHSGNQVLKEQFIHHVNSDSANHAMFSSYLKWYFEAIGGISLENNTAAFSKIILNPYFNKEMGNTQISINTIHGLISVITNYDNGLLYQVTLPKKIQYIIGKDLKNMSLRKITQDNTITLIFKKQN